MHVDNLDIRPRSQKTPHVHGGIYHIAASLLESEVI